MIWNMKDVLPNFWKTKLAILVLVKMKELLSNHNSPKSIIITVNAGHIPSDVWVHDMEVGGGRIIGEGCHFVDLMRYLVGYPIEKLGAPFFKKAYLLFVLAAGVHHLCSISPKCYHL